MTNLPEQIVMELIGRNDPECITKVQRLLDECEPVGYLISFTSNVGDCTNVDDRFVWSRHLLNYEGFKDFKYKKPKQPVFLFPQVQSGEIDKMTLEYLCCIAKVNDEITSARGSEILKIKIVEFDALVKDWVDSHTEPILDTPVDEVVEELEKIRCLNVDAIQGEIEAVEITGAIDSLIAKLKGESNE